MDDVLGQAMAPVLRDLRSAGIRLPEVSDEDWTGDPESPSAMLWSPDGSGTGIRVDRSAHESARVAIIAEQVQEWVIEELWGRGPTNWPQCPRHLDNHPLQASIHERVAVWCCPADQTPVATVGGL